MGNHNVKNVKQLKQEKKGQKWKEYQTEQKKKQIFKPMMSNIKEDLQEQSKS